jgi:hypothetical protein
MRSTRLDRYGSILIERERRRGSRRPETEEVVTVLTPERATALHHTERALQRAEVARIRRARRAALRARPSARRPAAARRAA